MIRIALIGCGHHGRESHAVPLARFAAQYPGRIALVAACDVDKAKAETFCNDFGFAKAYTDADAMLAAEKIDACHCVVPPRLTPAISSRMLERKMPCVIEKPPGVTREGLLQIQAAARQSKTPHIVSVNRRFMPHLNRGMKWAREQGPIEYIRVAMMRYNRNDPCFGFSTGIHALDATRYIMGDVASFRNHVQTGGSLSRDWQQIDFKFTSGALGRLDILPTTGFEEETYELFGQAYYVRIVSYMRRGTSVSCYLKNQLVIQENSEGQPQDVYRGEYAEVEELVSALETGRQPKPNIDDIAPSMDICLSIAEKADLPTAL